MIIEKSDNNIKAKSYIFDIGKYIYDKEEPKIIEEYRVIPKKVYEAYNYEGAMYLTFTSDPSGNKVLEALTRDDRDDTLEEVRRIRDTM